MFFLSAFLRSRNEFATSAVVSASSNVCKKSISSAFCSSLSSFTACAFSLLSPISFLCRIFLYLFLVRSAKIFCFTLSSSSNCCKSSIASAFSSSSSSFCRNFMSEAFSLFTLDNLFFLICLYLSRVLPAKTFFFLASFSNFPNAFTASSCKYLSSASSVARIIWSCSSASSAAWIIACSSLCLFFCRTFAYFANVLAAAFLLFLASASSFVKWSTASLCKAASSARSVARIIWSSSSASFAAAIMASSSLCLFFCLVFLYLDDILADAIFPFLASPSNFFNRFTASLLDSTSSNWRRKSSSSALSVALIMASSSSNSLKKSSSSALSVAWIIAFSVLALFLSLNFLYLALVLPATISLFFLSPSSSFCSSFTACSSSSKSCNSSTASSCSSSHNRSTASAFISSSSSFCSSFTAWAFSALAFFLWLSLIFR